MYATEEERLEARRASHRRWLDKEPGRRAEYYRLYQQDPERKKQKSERLRLARLADPNRFRAYGNKSYHKNKHNKTPSRNREYGMLYAARKRANKKNIPFDITISDIVIPSVCPCCQGSMARPSLDKVWPDQGYVKGNIAVICFDCNVIKSYGTAEQHRQIADYIERH